MIRHAALAAVAALYGCAADCMNPDWRSRGYDDGFGGHPPQDLRLAAQCPRRGIEFRQADYLEGWRAGHNEHDRLKTMSDDR